uniref:Uncharacterized protein n=1 Tax=viral metagenome TaxID=1070528 RepID=A0A6M3X5T9_9ZZZZ
MKTCPTCGRPEPEPIEDCEECKRMAKTTWIGEPPKCPKHSHLKGYTYGFDTDNNSLWTHNKFQPCLTEKVCEDDRKRGGSGVALVSCPCPKCSQRYKI